MKTVIATTKPIFGTFPNYGSLWESKMPHVKVQDRIYVEVFESEHGMGRYAIFTYKETI